jgi:hypothetical protein
MLGIVVSAGFYLMHKGKGGAITQTPELAGEYEGRMTVVINPRFGRSNTDKFPGWFDSTELLNNALEEAGLNERTSDSFTVTYNRNDGVDIVLKSGSGDPDRIEKCFSVLLNNVESQASAYYAQYAANLVSWFESLRDSGKDYSVQDYVRYQWARDLLSGNDTVLKVLYSFTTAALSGNINSGSGASPRMASLVIILASLFLAFFLAFVLNALKNIGADNEAMSKIRGALAKEKRDNI